VTGSAGVLEQLAGGPAHLVGWSDGGIVALLVALGRPGGG
jgi:pimeloyl-ACP methyl ester carboxylesterase